MTNELRDELAIAVGNTMVEAGFDRCLPPNPYYEPLSQQMSPEDIETISQAVIDHLTPMMKEVVGALEAHILELEAWENGDAWDGLPRVRKALASLPACWRENGGEV
jgi:hypothetical protein